MWRSVRLSFFDERLVCDFVQAFIPTSDYFLEFRFLKLWWFSNSSCRVAIRDSASNQWVMSSISSASDTEEWIRDLLHPPSLSYITEPSFPVSGSDLCTLNEARARRTRSQNWSSDEKSAYLEAKVEALRTFKGKDWEFISSRLRENHGFQRSPKNCEDLWGTLRKDFRAIGGHEASKGGPETSNWVSYWEMDENARSKKKLPRSFSLKWYNTMEIIFAAQEKGLRSANPAGTSNAKFSVRKGTGVVLEEVDAKLFKLCITPFVKQQVEDEVNSSLQSLPCRKTSVGTVSEQDELLTSLAPLVKKQVEGAVIYALQLLAISGFTFDEDDPITTLAPYVREQIKDALNSALQPVSSALQALAQKDQEVQEKLRAIEEQRRALDLEEIKIKRQRVGRHQCTLKTKSHKPHGPRGKNSSAGVIPALKGLNLARDKDQVGLPKDA